MATDTVHGRTYHGTAMSGFVGDIPYTVRIDDRYAVSARVCMRDGRHAEVDGVQYGRPLDVCRSLNVPVAMQAPEDSDPVAWLGSADGGTTRAWIRDRLVGIALSRTR